MLPAGLFIRARPGRSQKLREAVRSDQPYLLDRDTIFATRLDASRARIGLKVIQTPVRRPQANSPMRTADRDPPARVSGLDHSLNRGASSKDSLRLARALRQSRPSTLCFEVRTSRSAPQSPRPQLQRRRHRFDQASSSGDVPRIERTSPRVHPRGRCCVTVVEIFADHRPDITRDSTHGLVGVSSSLGVRRSAVATQDLFAAR
jgi:hypothetical protein